MKIDIDLLYNFEKGLNPQKLRDSKIPVRVIGFGEISSILQIDNKTDRVFKRMPLFNDKQGAEKYRNSYKEYCALLKKAGILLPEDQTIILEIPGRPVVLYIVQRLFEETEFCHRLIHHQSMSDTEEMLGKIVLAVGSVWGFNSRKMPGLELAIDGQLSNWVWTGSGRRKKLYYIDTSTPLYRKNGVEQLDPELILKSAPGFLRAVIRFFFLEDVMNRYYIPRQVFTDLAANLFKEQRPDLIPFTLNVMNRHAEDADRLSMKDIEKYYKEDKLIWTLFLAARRIDRFIMTKILRKRYEFILPGKIRR